MGNSKTNIGNWLYNNSINIFVATFRCGNLLQN